MPIPMCLAALLPAQDGAWYQSPCPIWIANLMAAAIVIVCLLRWLLSRIPADLEDAARIDGFGFCRFCWHVILPKAGPVIALTGIFILFAGWDDTIASLIPARPPAPSAFKVFSMPISPTGGSHLLLGANLHAIFLFEMAALLLLATPMIALIFLLQRYLRKGRLTPPRR